ncbi:Calx-beta domain-containing protein [Roseomonas chloroacetimidivorans]|uniref:Calx-beta domain-containing protein n=1 Tax=Roseomonas chloroacetimidivorans TaxID=1766656 RepID=UPI003C7663AA
MSTFYVSGTAANGIPAGNDATGDGSRERPWATVERANAAAANGDTVFLNDGVYTPAKALVVSNSVTWLGVTDYGATIRGAAGQSRVIGISEDQGGTVTFGKIVIDGANTTTALITVNDQPSTYTLHLDGTRLINPTSYGIQGVSTGTHANIDLDNVQFSATSALSMVNIPSLKAGDVSITGGSVNIVNVWRSGFGGIATVDADAAGSTVAISGVEANLHATGTDATSTGGIYYGIRLTDVQAPTIENNTITQTGTSADQTGYTVYVTYDKLASTPIDISGGVIRYNELYNYLDGSAGKIILVGHDSDPGVAVRNLANDFQIYGNSGFGDEGAEAAKLHGILVGWQDGAQVYDNALDYTSLAYVLKGMSGETLVFDNTDTRTTSKSLYQKGGDGVQFLYNTSYEASAFNPDAINIGDAEGGLYAATGAVVVGNTVVYTGEPDSFLTVWDGSSAATIAGNNYYSVQGNSSSAWYYQGTSYKNFDDWKAAHESSATYSSEVTLGQGAIFGAIGVSGQALKLVGMVNGVQTYSVKFTTGTAGSTTFAIGNFGASGAAAISGALDADMSGSGSASLSGSGTQDGTYAGLDSGELLTFRISYDGQNAVGGQVLHITGNYTNTRPIDIIIEGDAPVGSKLALSGPVSAPEGSAGETTLTYTVTRSGDTSGTSSANWTVTGSGANPADAADFGGTLPSGSVSFAAGETSKTVTIRVKGDTSVEADETFTLTLSSPSAGTTITTSTSTGTILNDDTLSAPSLALSGPASVSEGNSGDTLVTYTVTRSGDTSGTSSANWTVAGSGGNPADAADFGGTLPSGTVTFAAGETSKTITVRVSGDLTVEATEAFTLALSSPSAGTTLGTGTITTAIQNDDVAGAAPSLAISGPVSLAEGSAGATAFIYTVTRSGDTSGTSSASWAVAGSGANPADAADFGGALPSGTVTFAAGETSKTVTVNIAGDRLVEMDETFTLTLSSPSAGTTITTATSAGTILNDDAAGGTTPSEGDDSLTGTESADRIDALGGNDTVDGRGGDDALYGGAGNDILIGGTGIDTLDGGAGDDTYYADVTGDQVIERSGGGIDTVFFSGTGKFTLKSNVDNLQLTGTAGSSGTGNSLANLIIGNSGANVLSGGDGHDELRGGDGDDKITGGNGNDLILGDSGADTAVYSETRDTVTITRAADGGIIVQAASGTDTLYDVESFSFAGKTYAAADLVGGAVGSSLAISGPVSLSEGNSGATAFTFTVTRSGDTSGARTASWSVAGSGTNPADTADFGGILPGGTVSFAAGETSKSILVSVAGDQTAEADESFTVTLSSPSSGTAISTASSTGTIRNDDVAAAGPSLAVSGPASVVEGNSGITSITYTVTRAGDTSGTSSANWAVAGGGANAADATDFGGTLPGGTVSFAAGETSKTITLSLAGDAVVEPDETFSLTLSAPSAGTAISTGSTTTTIQNDDLAANSPSLALSGALSLLEGNNGTTAFSYTVTRSGDTSGTSTANWSVTGSGANLADAADFGGTLPKGTVTFAAGETSKTIVVPVAGDSLVEGDEGFTLTLSSPSAGTTITTATATGTVRNDDTAPGGSTPTAGDDNLVGTDAAERIDALAGNDTIDGRGGDDALYGGAGNDILIGGAGNDTLDGGLGDDTYYVDSIGDLVYEKSSAGTDTVYSSAAGKFTLKTNIENLVLTGTGNISGTGNSSSNQITGNAGANTLTGAGGDDTVFGMDGNDVIEGGAGRDVLSGGAGADQFTFRLAAEAGGGNTGLPSDLITDWATGDKVDLSKIDANASTSTNDAFTFIGMSNFTAAGQLRYVQDTGKGQTYIEGDTNGDRIADFSLTLSGLQTLTATDIML